MSDEVLDVLNSWVVGTFSFYLCLGLQIGLLLPFCLSKFLLALVYKEGPKFYFLLWVSSFREFFVLRNKFLIGCRLTVP